MSAADCSGGVIPTLPPYGVDLPSRPCLLFCRFRHCSPRYWSRIRSSSTTSSRGGSRNRCALTPKAGVQPRRISHAPTRSSRTRGKPCRTTRSSSTEAAGPTAADAGTRCIPMKRRTPLYALYTADAISLAGNAVAQLAIPWYVLVTTGSAALTRALGVLQLPADRPLRVPRRRHRRPARVPDDERRRRSRELRRRRGDPAARTRPSGSSSGSSWRSCSSVRSWTRPERPRAPRCFPDVVEVGRDAAWSARSGIRAGIQQGSTLVGAPLGGVLVAAFGATGALWLDAASFLVLGRARRSLFVPAAARAPERPRSAAGFFAELAEGMRFIWDQRARARPRR